MTSLRTCSIDGCEDTVHSWDVCNKHYKRWRRHGDPLGGGTFVGQPLQFIHDAVASETNECLTWPFRKNYDGYAMTDGNTRVHVVICKRRHGERPTESHEVAHSCGNPSCVNPRHLRWATRRENSNDKIRHGTQPLGAAVASARLTESQVLDIRRRSATERPVALAREFGVTHSTINAILTGKTWKQLLPVA